MTTSLQRIFYLLLFAWLSAASTWALPDLSTQQTIHSITVTQDHSDSHVFYFWPGAIDVATRSSDGGPELALSLARYSGSVVRNDAGETSLRANLYLRLQMASIEPDLLDHVRAQLYQDTGRPVTLRPMPVNRLDASLMLPMVDGEGDSQIDVNAVVESVGQEAGQTPFWTERDMFIPLDARTAELLEHQLRDGALAMSLNYSVVSRVYDSTQAAGELETSGSGELAEGFDDELDEALAQIEAAAAAQTPALISIAANAVPISVDANRFPDRIQRYDIDAALPPSYPSLTVYCYDFREQLRPDLFEKSVEIQAIGVAGGVTTYTTRFNNYQPDLYAQTIKFPFAVDLRQPYRWRSHEILNTGEQLSSAWQQSDSWVGIIDASSTAEQIDQSLGLLEQQ